MQTQDDDDSGDEDDESTESFGIESIPSNQRVPLNIINNVDHNKSIKKVQEMVRLFRKSPVRNDGFQKHLEENTESERILTLLNHCKTRWNSLLAMIDRFLLLKPEIQKHFIDIGEKFTLTDPEIAGLNQLKDALEPLKWASDKIACRGATILTAEAVFKTTIETLEALNTHIAKEILHSFKNRIKEKRNVDLARLIFGTSLLM